MMPQISTHSREILGRPRAKAREKSVESINKKAHLAINPKARACYFKIKKAAT